MTQRKDNPQHKAWRVQVWADNPQHKAWRVQVWANYHYGQMPMEEAERLAGPEPERWIEVEQDKVQ